MRLQTNWRSLGLLAVALVCGFSLAAVTLFFVVDRDATPPSLAPPNMVRNVPIVTQPYTDHQLVTLRFDRRPDTKLYAGSNGVLTADDCIANGVLRSGRPAFAIDGRPVLGLSTSVPFWRDLYPGDRGQDVVAVKEELARQGLHPTVGPSFGESDLAAVQRLIVAAGGGATDHLALADFVWLPAATSTVAACVAELGDRVDRDSVVATIGLPPTVAVTGAPQHRLAGRRLLQLDDVTVPVSDSLALRSRADAERISRTPTYHRALAANPEADSVTVPAAVTLANPVKVVVLPPSSITATSDRTGCVADESRRYRVTIVGGDLGGTLVLFGQGRLPLSVRAVGPARCN